ncbi:MAG: hypothetical protein J1F40_10245 [Prevotellaceae bacterium]|nr:hypothetical protein [Prevotellaceae bacterium]
MTVDSASYTIKINKIIEPNVRLIRVQPNDLKITLDYILTTLSSMCWISQIADILKPAYEVRVQSTIDKLNKDFTNGTDSEIIRNAGEYVVSELTRSSIVNELHYMDIPIGELFKEKASGNPGFDIFTVNLTEQILFGEAKYVANTNAYNNAIKQVNRFIREKRDLADLPDLAQFNINNAISKASNGDRGFIAGFSSTSISDDNLERNIKNNDAYKALPKDKELICVAVDVR